MNYNEINSTDNFDKNITLRGRSFNKDDLDIIQKLVSKYYDRGRSFISRAICEELDWRQPNGWLKDRACRDVLLRLDESGCIELPPPLVTRKRKGRDANEDDISFLSDLDLDTRIKSFPSNIRIEFAKGNNLEKVWNTLVSKFHYLGHTVIVGRCIKYLIWANDIPISAISFSSPAWHIESRDNILKSIGINNPHSFVINNSRFLILPNIQVKNLASHILSIVTKKIVEDWKSYYSITPLVSETFVQPSLYDGTCYKAANWIPIGFTKGYSKRGSSYNNSQEPKQVYLYGLNTPIRRRLISLVNDDED